jgi:hypothetical protein
MKKVLLNLSIALLLVLVVSSVNAQTRTATASGNWNNTATWGGASFPLAGNDVLINPGVTVTVNVASAACNTITFTAGATGSTITISGTNSLAVTGAIVVNGTTVTSGTQPTLINVGGGSLSCASLALNPVAGNFTSTNRRSQVTVSTGTLTVVGNISCSGDVDGAGGESGISFSNAGTLNVGGNFYTSPNFGYFQPDDATVNYTGANQAVLNAVYQNLTMSGSGTKTISAATTVAGTLTLTGGTLAAGTNLSMSTTGIPTIARTAGDLTGTLQGAGDYVVNYTGLSKTVGSELSGTGLRDVNVALTVGQTLTLNQNRAPDGVLTITSGTFDLSTFTINRSSNGGSLTLSNGATLKIGGTNGFPTGYNTHAIGSTSPFSTVEYAGAAQTITSLNSAQAYGHLILSGSGIKSFTGETVNGTLSIQGTATTTGTNPVYGAAAILEYKGSGAQTTSAVEFAGTGGTSPVNLRIDNTSGVILHAGRTINGALTLTNGYLTTTNTLLLTIGNAGSATTTNGAFVNGPLSKAKNTTTLFTFPVGTLTGGLRTIGVTPQTTTATTYRATFTSASPKTTIGNNIGTLAQISGCEFWNLTPTTGSTPARVSISWPVAASSCGQNYVGNVGTLVVARYNVSSWANEGQSSFSGTASGGGTVTSLNNLPSFGSFALGTTNASQNPLPVMFADVKAFQKNSGVEVSWSNLTERDLISYTVERSANGQSFTAFDQRAPKSNANDKESYSSYDATPLVGVNYYRIKALEISGKIVYSKVMKVDLSGKQTGISIYPNPVSGTQLSLSLNVKQGQYTVKVMNGAGQQVYSQRLIHQGGSMTQTVELPSSVKSGIYNMMVTGDNYRESKLFIVQ